MFDARRPALRPRVRGALPRRPAAPGTIASPPGPEPSWNDCSAAGAWDRALQPVPGVGRPPLRRPHPRPVRAEGRLLRRRPTRGQLRPVRDRRHQHAALVAVDVEPRDVAVPGRSRTSANITVPSLVVQSLADRGVFPSDAHAIHDALAADGQGASSSCPGSTTSRPVAVTTWPTSSPRGSRRGPRVRSMAATLQARWPRRCPPTTTTRTAAAPGARTTASGTPPTSRWRASCPPTWPACTCATPRTRCTSRSGCYHPFDGDGMLHQIAFQRRASELPQPVRADRRLPRRAGGGRVALDRDARPTRAVEARGRAGAPGAG